MAEYFGKEVPKLGFGLMRLPKCGEETDIEQFCRMTDLFLEAGFTYFDTAYVYQGSEEATRKALVERHPRESYTLATKLNVSVAVNGEDAKRQFTTSLERTGAGYFDYYLLHCLMNTNYAKYEEYGLWDFAADLKAKGLIRHLGFSFHAGPKLLDEILTAHPETEFVQLQINYADWENPKVTSRANYEVARKHGKSIVVMEPVKGGSLADPMDEVKRLFEGYGSMSYASWAIRFAASLNGVITVLSGMSNVQQMEDNLSYMKDFTPLNEREQEIIRQAQKLYGNSATIPCTACRYCVKGCPKQIPIPEIFAAANKRLGSGLLSESLESYRSAAPEGRSASDCIKCRQCERACPQHLAVVDYLSQCAQMFKA